jgi:hypothetical protein
MAVLALSVFHFPIVEDREVFPRYELTGLGNAGLRRLRKHFCPRGHGALATRGQRIPALMAGHFISNAEELVSFYAWR